MGPPKDKVQESTIFAAKGQIIRTATCRVVGRCSVSRKYVRRTIVPIFLICTNHFSKHRVQCPGKSFNHSVPLRMIGRCSQFVDTHQLADSLKYGAFKVRPSISQYLQRSTVSNNYNFHQCLCHSAGFLISHWNGFNELCEIVHDGQYEYVASSASWVGTSNIYAQFLEWFSAGYHL